MVKSDLETVIHQFIPRYTIKVSRGQRYAAPIDDQPQDLGPLVDALKADRRFGRLGLDKGAITLPSGAHGQLGLKLANWLIFKTLESKGNASGAIEKLARFVKSNTAKAFYAIALTGVEVSRTTKFAEGIELINIDKVPEHHFKQILLHEIGYRPFERPVKPTAALIYRFQHSPVFVPDISKRSKNPDILKLRANQMHSLSRLLTLVGPCAPTALAHWYAFEDDVPGSPGSTWGSEKHEIPPSGAKRIGKFSGAQAKKLFSAFEKLPNENKDALRIPIERLNLSLRRSNSTDKAIELGISLESVLTGGRNTSSAIAYLFRLRGSLIAGGTAKTKSRTFDLLNAVYDLRSRAIHGDKLPEHKKVSGQRLSKNDILWEGSEICALVIQKIIERGGIPEWDQELLQGNL